MEKGNVLSEVFQICSLQDLSGRLTYEVADSPIRGTHFYPFPFLVDKAGVMAGVSRATLDYEATLKTERCALRMLKLNDGRKGGPGK